MLDNGLQSTFPPYRVNTESDGVCQQLQVELFPHPKTSRILTDSSEHADIYGQWI